MRNEGRSSGQDNASREGVGVGDRGELLKRCEEALSMILCPHYQDGGYGCGYCHQEPACTVNAPLEGWEFELAEAASALAYLSSARTSAETQEADCPSHQSESGS